LIYVPLDLPEPPRVDIDLFTDWVVSKAPRLIGNINSPATGEKIMHFEEKGMKGWGFYPWIQVSAFHHGYSDKWIAEFDKLFPDIVDYVHLFPYNMLSGVTILLQKSSIAAPLHTDSDDWLGMRFYLHNEVKEDVLYFHPRKTRENNRISTYIIEGDNVDPQRWEKYLDLDNKIYSNFIDNKIGNNFENNILGETGNTSYFEDNNIGNNFKGNLIIGDFLRNKVGKSFQANEIEGNFDDNVIGNYFFINNIGDNFSENFILNNFQNNDIADYFSYNRIGSNFINNTIDDDFGFGGSVERGNVIGNSFQNNNIGEYFYDNNIGDHFENNQIGDYFQFNRVETPLNNIDFTEYLGRINTISFTPISGTDAIYSDVVGLTSGEGVNAVFEITVSGDLISAINITNSGKLYKVGDTITINSSSFGGTEDLILTVDTLNPIPMVYEYYNKTIQKDFNGNNILVAIANGNLYVTENITEPIFIP
jgi:hypothetical protein